MCESLCVCVQKLKEQIQARKKSVHYIRQNCCEQRDLAGQKKEEDRFRAIFNLVINRNSGFCFGIIRNWRFGLAESKPKLLQQIVKYLFGFGQDFVLSVSFGWSLNFSHYCVFMTIRLHQFIQEQLRLNSVNWRLEEETYSRLDRMT